MKNKWMLFITIGIGVLLIGIGFLGLNNQSVKKVTSEVIEGRQKMLPIPALLSDENPADGMGEYTLNVQEGVTEFIDGKLTPTMGYNGNYLGPVIKVTDGDEVQIHVNNELGDSTSVHWHGLEVPGGADGGPHQVIGAGSQWDPNFTINQKASTLWFHPHVIGTTATQVYAGLAGLIIIEDEVSKSLNLPDTYGFNDIPLIIQDRSFNDDGSFSYVTNMMDGAIGDHVIVNGAVTPYLEVSQIKMRFRLLNGANASNYNLQLSDGSDFYQIASDGGFLEKPIKMNQLFIAPAERMEVIIDFSKYEEGQVIELRNDRQLIMSFRVGKIAEDTTLIPDQLTTIERIDESLATITKTIELDGMGHMVSLNGKTYDMSRIDDNAVQGAYEIWEITTNRSMMGSMGHPFHIHGTQFQILDRDGKLPNENELGFKDTVFVNAGETVRIIVKFKYEGIYMYHCHILEHEEAGMMGQLEVKK